MMQLRLLPLFPVLLVVPAVAGEIVGDLIFPNGDRLSGLSGMIIDDGHLVLPAGEVLPEPQKVGVDRLVELRLNGGGLPVVEANHVADLELTNGDRLRGQLVSLDQDRVTLDTSFGGKLGLKRSMCRSLTIQTFEPTFYAGPDALENCYEVVIQRHFVYVRKRWMTIDAGGNDSIGRAVNVPELAQQQKARLEFLIKTKDEATRIPVGRKLTIDFSSKGDRDFEIPRRRKRDVRAWLHDGRPIIFQLRSLEGSSVTGYNDAYGDAEFKLAAFSRIEFNIYDEDLESMRSGSGR